MFPLSSGKVRIDGDHTAHLLHAEWATFFTVSATQAGICLDSQFGIVVGRDVIARQSQIIILVYEANINACGAGLAMVAVDAGAGNSIGSERTDDA